MPREDAVLVVAARLAVVVAPFFAGAFFVAAAVLAGAFCRVATAASALQASAIIAAMAAQLKSFFIDSIVSLTNFVT